VIVLDAGHGGHDTGALGLNHSEKNLTLQMTYALKQSLEARGATTIMTRSDDTFVSLEQRVGIANGSGADLFVSIHCNSCLKRNAGSGSQTYTRTPQSLQLARALHPRLVGAVQARNGGIHRERNFYVIRNTTMPSVLLEIAYINNTQEELKLADPTFHRKLGESLAQGLLEYYGGE
jgi:N-acetylmuramoyl-L-alanine amidase